MKKIHFKNILKTTKYFYNNHQKILESSHDMSRVTFPRHYRWSYQAARLRVRLYLRCSASSPSLAIHISFDFHPNFRGRWTHFDEHIFPKGLVQPPTTVVILDLKRYWKWKRMKVQKFRDFQVGDDWVEWLNLSIELLGLQKECAYLKKSILFVSMYVYTWNLMFSISSGGTFMFTYFDITYLFSIRQTHPKYITFKWYTLPETNKSPRKMVEDDRFPLKGRLPPGRCELWFSGSVVQIQHIRLMEEIPNNLGM